MTLPPEQPRQPASAAGHPGFWQAWRVALRPGSLWLACSPVLLGAALGWRREGQLDAGAALAALAAALLMQVITNLQNDIGFTHRQAHRIPGHGGLPRASALGWIPVSRIRVVIRLLSLLSLGLGLWLVAHRGWPVLALGGASLLAALAYMGGPRPIAYTPLGELTVLIFFGWVAVLGTEWLLTGGFQGLSVVLATALGGLAAAALSINNLRDLDHDARAGRRTLAVCLGPAGARRASSVLLLLPFFLTLPAAWLMGSWLGLLPFLLWPKARRLQRDLMQGGPPSGLTARLLQAFRLQMGFALLLSLGLVLNRLLG